MIDNPAVDRVVELLTQEGGYALREVPFTVASVTFNFAAVLTSDRSLDLVVVVDTILEAEELLRQRLETLSTALDVVASRRSVTIVLVGPPPRGATLDALVRSGRVLIVGTPSPSDAESMVRHALAVLLPLRLPTVHDTTAQTWEQMRAALAAGSGPSVDHLLERAPAGARSVQQALGAWLAEPFSGLDDND